MPTTTPQCSPLLADPEWDWEAARTASLRVARRLLTNEADAEEAAQEALIRAWRRRGQCRGAAEAWILEITRNEALRVGARRKRQEAAPLDGAPEGQEQSAAEDVIRRLAVSTALSRLSEADRALLALRYEADLTHSGVAARTGLPVGTVKVRLHRLRNQLRTALTEVS